MPAVFRELGEGRKRTHWMWYVFPQMHSLGRSSTALRYGIVSPEEALAYLAHPVLGQRLIQCTKLVMALRGRSAHAIFGSPDDLKFRSSMSLFAATQSEVRVFSEAIAKFFDGLPDPQTLELL